MSFPDALDPHKLDVSISELLVATADGHDPELDRRITEVLQLLRVQLRMDVVFVSEFVGGQRVFRFMEGGERFGARAGDAAPLEQSYCQRVVQGRMPELVVDAAALVRRGELPDVGVAVGGHLSTPVVLQDGRVYGTVCCFSAAAMPALDASALTRLQQCARLVARKVDAQLRRGDFAATDWALTDWALTQPGPLPSSA